MNRSGKGYDGIDKIPASIGSEVRRETHWHCKKGEFVWFPAEVKRDHGAAALEDCTFLLITNAPFDIEKSKR